MEYEPETEARLNLLRADRVMARTQRHLNEALYTTMMLLALIATVILVLLLQ